MVATHCYERDLFMRKVTIKLEMRMLMSVNEDIEIAEVIDELDYRFNDTTTVADVLDTEIIDYEVIDSR